MQPNRKYSCILTDKLQGHVVSDVLKERDRQDSIWGEQNHDALRWMVFIMEELGEAAQALNDAKDPELQHAHLANMANYRTEMVQVAALAISMIECFDRNNKGDV